MHIWFVATLLGLATATLGHGDAVAARTQSHEALEPSRFHGETQTTVVLPESLKEVGIAYKFCDMKRASTFDRGVIMTAGVEITAAYVARRQAEHRGGGIISIETGPTSEMATLSPLSPSRLYVCLIDLGRDGAALPEPRDGGDSKPFSFVRMAFTTGGRIGELIYSQAPLQP